MSDPRLRSIFVEALDQPTAAERARFLDQACGADKALREQVEALLQAHDEAGAFLAEPSKSTITLRITDLPLTEKAGDRIGRYKLLQQIGEGGCGVVYMAEQEEPVRRRVALKVIKLGMDTKHVIARFDAERQALAMMDHPNIAKVLDAGATDSGRPYFVMELIRGVKITEYCDEHQLSAKERLNLFIQVCQAIQHAHQKGIIHRDVKPSNILVTINDDVAVPKVIDFGIAKATQGRLTDKTLFTAFEQFIGTPAYMSPEQAVMTSLDIDTRSDIYSLGVLLYELLTGRPPFDQQELLAAGLDEMRRTIREKEPPKPSTRLGSLADEELTTTAKRRHTDAPKLIHLVQGDLDWIVMKCLEKDRMRRYGAANDLVADLQRHLNHEPIAARPPTRLYEFQKALRRHKLGFSVAIALFLTLAIGGVVSMWQAIRASRAEQKQAALRQIAEKEATRSQQVAEFMKSMLKGVGPGVARGRDATLLHEILEQTASRISVELTNQPEIRGDLWSVLGLTYEDIGDRTNAIRAYDESVKSYREAFKDNNTKLAIALGDLGSSQSFIEMIRDGTNNAASGLKMARTLGDDTALATCLVKYARALAPLGGGTPVAEPYLREAVTILEKLGTSDALMFTYAKLAGCLTNLSEAEQLSRRALEYSIRKYGEDNHHTAYIHLPLGTYLLRLDRIPEAADEFGKALKGWRKFYSPNHPHREFLFHYRIYTLLRQNKYRDALEEIDLEQASSPANRYCALVRIALEINRATWPMAPEISLTKMESGIDTSKASYDAAIILARNGRTEEYRRCCQALLANAEKQGEFESAEQAAKVTLLFPPDATMLEAAGKVADFAATAEGREDFMAWALSTRALAECRRGNFSSSVELTRRALDGKGLWPSCSATAYCVQALAYANSGEDTKAREALSLAERSAQSYREEILWNEKEQTVLNVSGLDQYWKQRDWIISGILKREVEAKLSQARK